VVAAVSAVRADTVPVALVGYSDQRYHQTEEILIRVLQGNQMSQNRRVVAEIICK
jgi:hypothetical protein